ncbi:MAG: hypothetical protein NVS1B6_05870 [Steroidobacteraceae bacterium]
MNVLTVRRWHSYIGLFIAPSVLFFALSGAAQLFHLHEAHGRYQPPHIVEKLSSVHKDQVFALGDHNAPPTPGNPDVTPSAAPQEEGDKPGSPTFILKVFFAAVALGLTSSASLGLWIGLTQTRRKKTAWFLVIGGMLIPVGLLLL